MKNFPFKVKDRMDMVALGLCLFALFFWVYLLSYKYYLLGYYDWDFAFFAQGMWDLSHGFGHVSLFDVNFFSNHANLIAYLVIPIYKIFAFPLTLVFLKVISYVIAAFVLYVLAREKLGPAAALIILLFYLIYSPNVIGIVYEFDFESLAPAFLMLIYYFYVKDRWLGFMICAGVLILIKENLPLIVLAFSLHALFVKKDKIRWAVIPGTLALVSFYLLVFVFIPHCSGRPIGEEPRYYIGHNYKDLGGSIEGVLLSFIFHPVKIWQHIMTPANQAFLTGIFRPFMCLPLAAPGILFLISPIFAQHLLSSSVTEHSMSFAYVLTMAPYLFVATIRTLSIFYERHKKAYYLILSMYVSLNLLFFFNNFLFMKYRFMEKAAWDQTKEVVRERWELFHMVPQDASVVASFCFLAPLSQRKDLYAFYKVYDASYQNAQGSYKIPSNVQYALIDFKESWLLGDMSYDPVFTSGCLNKFFHQNKWIVKRKYGKIVLYERQAAHL